MRTQHALWNQRRLWVLTLATLMVITAWWRVLAASSGLEVLELQNEDVPMRFIARKNTDAIPGVVIAHGFGASKQIMLGYAYALAHAGYGVMLFDFDGHAANTRPFDRSGASLQRNIDAAYAAVIARPQIDAPRLALLGHSMGGGAVLRAAIRHADRYQATIAVSASSAEVTPDRPRNLLLMPGAWEGPLVERSRELLAAAGGKSEEFATGKARSLVIVPAAEHILVLFSSFAHQTSIAWLNRTFGEQLVTSYRDSRLLWFGASLVGWMLLAIAAAPAIRSRPARVEPRYGARWIWWSMVVMPIVASLAIAFVNRLVPISELGGIQVGGALSLWFLVMGLGRLRFFASIPSFKMNQLRTGLALFAFLWIAVGIMSQVVWLQWYLTPARLARWPIMAICFLPWLLAAGQVQSGRPATAAIACWLAQNLFIVGGLVFLVFLVPALFVVILMLPAVPLLTALMHIAGATVEHPWAFAIGNALFFGWQMAAYFPYTG